MGQQSAGYQKVEYKPWLATRQAQAATTPYLLAGLEGLETDYEKRLVDDLMKIFDILQPQAIRQYQQIMTGTARGPEGIVGLSKGLEDARNQARVQASAGLRAQNWERVLNTLTAMATSGAKDVSVKTPSQNPLSGLLSMVGSLAGMGAGIGAGGGGK